MKRRPKTLAIKRISKDETRIGLLLYPEHTELPRTRADCVDGPRPCPLVRCRWNLYLDVTTIGSIIFNHPPEVEPWNVKESCALDVAARAGRTLEEVGELFSLTRERVRQIEARALDGLVGSLGPWAEHEPTRD